MSRSCCVEQRTHPSPWPAHPFICDLHADYTHPSHVSLAIPLLHSLHHLLLLKMPPPSRLALQDVFLPLLPASQGLFKTFPPCWVGFVCGIGFPFLVVVVER